MAGKGGGEIGLAVKVTVVWGEVTEIGVEIEGKREKLRETVLPRLGFWLQAAFKALISETLNQSTKNIDKDDSQLDKVFALGVFSKQAAQSSATRGKASFSSAQYSY